MSVFVQLIIEDEILDIILKIAFNKDYLHK